MTEVKPTGPAAAAREIISKIWPIEDPNDPDNGMWTEQKTAQFESIISRHCPQDKAVEKLVEALRAIEIKTTKALDVVVKMCDHIRRSYSHTEKPNQVFDLIYGLRNVIRAALADYEKVKDTSCG